MATEDEEVARVLAAFVIAGVAVFFFGPTMIEQIAIKNYQSLSSVDLTLDKLTVIVGASSSGKSAVTRAIRTLTSNTRGHAFITHGERVAIISAVTDRGTVTLKRGMKTTDDEYVTIPADPNEQQHSYTKLGGEVPTEVSEFIGIDSRDPINYAAQFDKPYLLAESAGEVARILGALTNVNVIFEASRESNTRRTRTAAEQRMKQSDLAVIREKIPEYRPLKAQRAALEEAETELAAAAALTVKVNRLEALTATLDEADTTIKNLAATAALEVPDLAPITDAAAKLARFQAIWKEIADSAGIINARTADLEELAKQEFTLEAEYTAALIAAQVCPTCNQSTKELEHAH